MFLLGNVFGIGRWGVRKIKLLIEAQFVPRDGAPGEYEHEARRKISIWWAFRAIAPRG